MKDRKEYLKNWEENNKEKRSIINKRYYEKNKDKNKGKHKEYYKEYYKKHKK